MQKNTTIVVLCATLLVALGLAAAAHFRYFMLTHKAIFLSKSSSVRSEVCAALAARTFTVADEVATGRKSGKSADEINRLLPSRNWSYEQSDDGFIVRWKLSYDDDIRYQSWSDSVVGSNDYESTTKRKTDPNRVPMTD